MRYSLWIASALAPFALAAPTYDAWTPAEPRDAGAISTYFNQLAQRVGQGKLMGSAPVCDVSKAQMPVSSTPLPPPSAGLTLKHVAIGRGTQNYTCDTTNATAVPAAIGAVATLYNATCVAATSATVLATLPNFALQYNLNTHPGSQNPANLLVSGAHWFTEGGIPFFDLDTTAAKIGTIPCKKDASAPAPADASKGQGGKGNGAVPWLKLSAKDGATGNLQEVYRLNTAGGAAPATCAGMPATFEIQYAAEYWFFQK